MAFCYRSFYGITGYGQAGTDTPTELRNYLQSSLPPLNEADGPTTATKMVLQYLCQFLFRRDSTAVKSSDGTNNAIYQSACSLDVQRGIQIQSDNMYPSLVSIMDACCINKFQGRFPGIYTTYLNTVAALKTYIHRFGAALLEINFTSNLISPSKKQLDLTGGGEYSDSHTKLFIAYGWDQQGNIICMDNLGMLRGFCGLIKISESVLNTQTGRPEYPYVFSKGAVFANCY